MNLLTSLQEPTNPWLDAILDAEKFKSSTARFKFTPRMAQVVANLTMRFDGGSH